jgi:uncharacterized protein YajQ (UPF0234 family)
MPSFDVVSEVDLQEVRNAVDQANRELAKRFDFRGVDAGFEQDEGGVLIKAEEEFQLGQMLDILQNKLTSRKVDVNALEAGEIEASGKQKRQRFRIVQGIDADTSRSIVKLVKGTKLKVQTAIQGEKVRVTGKKRDDLQSVMALLRDSDISVPMQFDNFRD